MAQSSQPESTPPPPVVDLSERVARYKQEVEKVVREVGEHPQYELKRACSLSNLSEKIEFIKDIQSIATSRIETEKYLVIGADESTKSFCAVVNAQEFDDANVRQIFERYLDPIPLFEVFRLGSSDGCAFILFVIPKQPYRRVLAKVTVYDPKNSKLLIREGDLWTKGLSSGKGLAKVEDWDSIYEDVIEREAEQRARVRTAHTIEIAVARERLKSYGKSILPSVYTDDEFFAVMEDVCTSKDDSRFKLLLERLRDDTVEGWHSIGAYENPFAASLKLPTSDSSISDAQQKVREHVKNVLRPAMHWLTLAGIYIIKNTGPVAFLDAVVDLLSEIYETTHSLRTPRLVVPLGHTSQSIEEHISHTVPALESMVSLHLIGAYIAKRKRFEYLRSVFRAEGYSTGWQGQQSKRRLVAFWPLNLSEPSGEPEELRSWGGRLKLCTGRVKTDRALTKLFGSEQATLDALCQYEFCLEINSFYAFPQLSPETGNYVAQFWPKIDFTFNPDMVAFSLECLNSLAMALFDEVRQAKPKLFRLILFHPDLVNLVIKPGGPKIFGHCLDELSGSQVRLWMAKSHYPPRPMWSQELAKELKVLREAT